jgi:hypothetical protein
MYSEVELLGRMVVLVLMLNFWAVFQHGYTNLYFQ